MNLTCRHCHKPMTWEELQRAEIKYHCKAAQLAGIQNVELLIEDIKNRQWREGEKASV